VGSAYLVATDIAGEFHAMSDDAKRHEFLGRLTANWDLITLWIGRRASDLKLSLYGDAKIRE
jgi:hypothetical protein